MTWWGPGVEAEKPNVGIRDLVGRQSIQRVGDGDSPACSWGRDLKREQKPGTTLGERNTVGQEIDTRSVSVGR